MEEIGTKDILAIIDVLNECCGVDFSNYAFSSFRRRIIRFLEVNKIRDFDNFIDKLKTDRGYADTLIREITVNVTEMFRDPSFWIFLRDNVIPEIKDRQPIKIWHAACSTGEEVYSMAIMLKEANLLDCARILATDINMDVLEVAKRGSFSLKNQVTNNKNYCLFGGKMKLSDYFDTIDNRVEYDPSLISNVEFRCHNLVHDSYISNFDLIMCRNVLIYFNFELQEKVIQMLSNNMLPGSFLGIGSKESIEWNKNFSSFRTESYEEKIYRKID